MSEEAVGLDSVLEVAIAAEAFSFMKVDGAGELWESGKVAAGAIFLAVLDHEMDA